MHGHKVHQIDPGWSVTMVTGGVETKIGRKGANFARFWPIPPHAPLLDPPLLIMWLELEDRIRLAEQANLY